MFGSLFSSGIGLGVVIVLAVLAVIAMLIGAKILRREQQIRLTRLGWFIERERFPDDEDERRKEWENR